MFNLKGLKVFDIFAPTYQQKVINDSNKRSTIIGGLLSIVIILICLAYASYLFQSYFGGKYQPKQNDYTSYSPTEKQFNLKLSSIKIFIYNDIETLLQNEMKNKIKYFTISLSIISSHQIIKSYYAENCFDQSLEKQVGLNQGYYYCFAQKNSNEQIMLEQSEYKNTSFRIDFNYCQQNQIKQGYKCASTTEVNSYMYDQNNNFQISLETDIYNLHQDQYINTFYIQDLFPKNDEILNNVMLLQLTHMEVIKGMIVQSSSSNTYFYNILNEHFYFPQNQNQNQLKYPITAEIKLDKPVKYETIQFVPITQVLSEAWTTISLFLVLGNIARMISETEFLIDLLQVQLKYYYKKTARKLCPKDDDQGDDQNYVKIDQSNKVIKENEIVENTNFVKNIQNYFNLTKWQKISIFYLPSFCQKKKDKTEEQNILENLIKQTNNEMNLYEMHKELLKMKLLIKMLVTPEQYAAIQMCGCDILQNDAMNSQINQSNNTSFQQQDINQNKKNDNIPGMNIFVEEQEEVQQNNQQAQSDFVKIPVDQKKEIKSQLQNQNQSYIQMQEIDKTKSSMKIIFQNSKKLQLNHLEILNKIDIDPSFKQEKLKGFLSQSQEEQKQYQLNQRIRNCMLGLEQPQYNQFKAIFKLNYNIEQYQPKLQQYH